MGSGWYIVLDVGGGGWRAPPHPTCPGVLTSRGDGGMGTCGAVVQRCTVLTSARAGAQDVARAGMLCNQPCRHSGSALTVAMGCSAAWRTFTGSGGQLAAKIASLKGVMRGNDCLAYDVCAAFRLV